MPAPVLRNASVVDTNSVVYSFDLVSGVPPGAEPYYRYDFVAEETATMMSRTMRYYHTAGKVSISETLTNWPYLTEYKVYVVVCLVWKTTRLDANDFYVPYTEEPTGCMRSSSKLLYTGMCTLQWEVLGKIYAKHSVDFKNDKTSKYTHVLNAQ